MIKKGTKKKIKKKNVLLCFASTHILLHDIIITEQKSAQNNQKIKM